VAIDVALLAVRQLLNNPPPSGALPTAAEQWHHDVDQLIVAAINTPHRERRRQPSVQQSRISLAAYTSSVAQAPQVLSNARPPVQHRTPMVSYTTTDLREGINHRCGGEDSRTTIKCHRERCRDIDDRNLEKDFDLHALVRGGLVAHPPLPPNPLEFQGGGAWHLPHTCVWRFSRSSSSPTYQRSTMGRSTPPSSWRSTTPLSSLQAGMRPSWPTTSL
jgi:hypothetical protein